MSSYVYLDGPGNSYIQRELPPPTLGGGPHDELLKMEEEQEYLRCYKGIFEATVKGDFATCKMFITENNFRDFDAQRYGVHGTPEGLSLRSIAVGYNRTDFIAFFDDHLNQTVSFDSHRAYIRRAIPVQQDRSTLDVLGRTELDRQYLADYQVIWNAASEGDETKCLEVIQRGFRDFNAISYGYGACCGRPLNCSPMSLAQNRNHHKVVELFNRYRNEKIP